MTTIRVNLARWRGQVEVGLPAETVRVVKQRYAPVLADPAGTLRRCRGSAVAGPSPRDLVRPGQKVAICDVTRAQPGRRMRQMLEVVLEHLDGVVPDDPVSVLRATGSPGAGSDVELRRMLVEQLFGRLRVADHGAIDRSGLGYVAVLGDKVPVWLARERLDAYVRDTTGLVEPHFFAGFSSGPNVAAPGSADLDAILCLYVAGRICRPRAWSGVTGGNPVHDDIRSIVAGTVVRFGFDVILNRDQQIVAGFAGDAAAVTACREVSMAGLETEADVVVTANAGYLLDQNSQSVRALSAVAEIVAPGGTIVVAAECRGFPRSGRYWELLGSDPAVLLAAIERSEEVVADQWQVQVQARIQQRSEAFAHTAGLSVAELAEVQFGAGDDIAATVSGSLAGRGPGARMAVLPEGPTTIPHLLYPHRISSSTGW